MRHLSIKLIVVLGACILTGCGLKKIVMPTNESASVLPSGVFAASDSSIKEMQNRFKNNHVKIVTIGQNYLISIPSEVLFGNNSPQIKWGAYGLLNDIACYLREFHKIGIEVRAFSSQYRSNLREHSLTLARANYIANYLWSQGVDSRFLFTQGLGSDKPIINLKNSDDRSANSRIEISFRNAVV